MGGGGLPEMVSFSNAGDDLGVGEAKPPVLVLVGTGVATAGLGPWAGAGTGTTSGVVGGEATGGVADGVELGDSLLGDLPSCRHQGV